jgi:hypothetical protein
MTALKVIIDTIRLVLLFLVMFLPLIFLIVSSQLAVKIDSLPSISLFLPTVIVMHYFMGKYGSIYKLALISLIRNDIMQFLEKHEDVYIALLAGSAMYVVTIYSLLTDLVTSQLPLIKIILGIVIILMLVYVLPNKKYENALKLIQRIWGFPS